MPSCSIDSITCGDGRTPRFAIAGEERRKIDRPHRLRAQDERIVARAIAIDLGLHRQRADAVEAQRRRHVDAAQQQVRGREVARVFERAAQRHDPAAAAVIVPRRPVILGAGTGIGAADRRQADGLVAHQRVRLQSLARARPGS